MPLDIAVRHALLRIGAVALASGSSAVVLLLVGRLVVFDLGIPIPLISQASPASTGSPSPTAVLSEVATPNPSPTVTASPAATATPAPTPAPLALTSFRFGGRTYVGIVAPEDTATFAAPFAGIVEVRTYQFIDGEVRVGSSIPTLPFFPYISIITADRKITYRPGALGTVTEILATNGTTVAAGDPLFRLVAPGRSSWATFYNASAPYQVVVSLQSVPAGRDLDPLPYLTGS
jgi:multidrug efflux pump subunit AcrA (membrane-fusion protein)